VISDGLHVDVLIGVDGTTVSNCLATGQPIPAPILTRGAIDTGSDMTGVSSALLHRLGVPVQYQTSTHTAAGSLSVRIFEVSLGISHYGNLPAPRLVESNLLVLELTTPLPKIEVLIGLDVLLGCRFALDGPGLQFTLEF
jgi:hypothetical protein